MSEGACARTLQLQWSASDHLFPTGRMRPRIPERAARMAESVDALVSNTNDSNVVPVRPRLRVPGKNLKQLYVSCLGFLFCPPCPHFVRIFLARRENDDCKYKMEPTIVDSIQNFSRLILSIIFWIRIIEFYH